MSKENIGKTFEAWRHILKLRTDKAAHPQMRQIMNQILAVFKEKLPVIVEDIGND